VSFRVTPYFRRGWAVLPADITYTYCRGRHAPELLSKSTGFVLTVRWKRTTPTRPASPFSRPAGRCVGGLIRVGRSADGG
jgi:hypothetical protein